MLRQIRKQHFHHQTALYEDVYARCLEFLPELPSLAAGTTLCYEDDWLLQLHIEGQDRYTTLFTLRIRFGDKALPNLAMKVRVCHDAKVAEVVEYQGQGYLMPDYIYPNPAGFQADEKRQTNLLLKEWLAYFCRQDLALELAAAPA